MGTPVPCRQKNKCKDRDCSVYGSHDVACWKAAFSAIKQESGRQKPAQCLQCTLFRESVDVSEVLDLFSQTMDRLSSVESLLEEREKELEFVSMELALGLSEVFEALKKIAKGSPGVRITETSRLELVSRLKSLINETAEDLDETIDLTHEFAIGLAEHFDVMQRVRKGDLSARVKGASQVELLECQKELTNRMIESVALEIDKRRKAEKSLRHMNDMLEEIVSERTLQLTEANRTLEKEIDERKQAQASLKKERDFIAAVLSTAGALVVVLDGKGRIVRFNNACERTTGYAVQEVLGKYIWECVGDHEQSASAKAVFEKLQSGHGPSENKNYWQTKNGDRRCIHWANTVMLDPEGHVEYMVAVGIDITEKDIVEKEKAALEVQLVQAQKMQALGTLAGGIAHDFNNLLFPAMGFTEMAMDDVPEKSVAQSNMVETLKALKRGKELVAQILTFSRQGDRDCKPIRLEPIIQEALQLLRASLPATIEIREKLNEHCDPTIANSTQIHQIIMNLGSNAYHAMGAKGGVLEVSLSSLRFGKKDVLGKMNLQPGPYLQLSISDTGCGMDRETMRRVFEPYFTTKPLGEGSGLGLSVVHGIVTGYGGDITVDSETGKGTTFNIYLPSIETTSGATVTQTQEAPPGGKEHILLVDEEGQIIRMMRMMLERLGYTVTSRTSSIEALEVFRARPDDFDLLVTDQSMRKMTGIALAREVMMIRPHLPVILSSGFAERLTEKEARAVGIKSILMKPVVRNEMARAIRRVLDGERKG